MAGILMPAAAAFPRIVAAIFYADGGYMAYAGWAGGSLKTEEWFSGCLWIVGRRGNFAVVGWALVAHTFCVMRQVEPRGHEWPTLRETRQPENGEGWFSGCLGTSNAWAAVARFPEIGVFQNLRSVFTLRLLPPVFSVIPPVRLRHLSRPVRRPAATIFRLGRNRFPRPNLRHRKNPDSVAPLRRPVRRPA